MQSSPRAVPPQSSRRPAARRLARAGAATTAALAGLVLTACSVVPGRVWPPRLLGEIEVLHVEGGEFEVPGSDAVLTVLELHAEPAPLAERYDGGKRYWRLPEGGAVIRCRYRVFGQSHVDGDPFAGAPRIDSRFPGARVLDHRAVSRPAPNRGDLPW